MSNEETKRKLLQKDSFRLAKGLVLLSKRTPFGMQKDSFWDAKGLLLQPKRGPFESQKDSFSKDCIFIID